MSPVKQLELHRALLWNESNIILEYWLGFFLALAKTRGLWRLSSDRNVVLMRRQSCAEISVCSMMCKHQLLSHRRWNSRAASASAAQQGRWDVQFPNQVVGGTIHFGPATLTPVDSNKA